MQDGTETLRQVYTTTRGGQGPRFVSQLTRETFAVVLAGGRGSRLKQLTDWRSKPAVPFAGKFRIIDFTLSNCVNSGIRRMGVATQYKAQSLIRHVQRGWAGLDGRMGEFVELLPAQQRIHSSWYLGTADAVYQNLDILRRHAPRYVLVLAGDHVYKMDYGKMLAEHVARGADLTVGCVEVPRDHARALGVMAVDGEGAVASFLEKPAQPPALPGRPDRALASMGIYVFNAGFLYEQLVRDADAPGSSHDFGRDVIPHAVGRGYRVIAHDFRRSCVNMSEGIPYWRDVGTVDAFWEANMELTKVTPPLNLYDQDWPIWTYQEHVPPAKFVLDEEGRRGEAVNSLISGGCIVSGATVRESLLFSNTLVSERSQIYRSVLLPNVHVGRDCRISRAILDEGCDVPDGTRIGLDLVADSKRFHVTERGVVLVTPEMLNASAGASPETAVEALIESQGRG